MAPSIALSWSNFIHSQNKVKLPVPTKSFAGKTVIVTGSNTGMGLEAARHIARLKADKVVLACRSLERGNAAARSIEESTKCGQGVVEVWQVDLADYKSIQSFADRVNRDLTRLDVVVENAGIYTYKFEMMDGDEGCIKVNALGTMFMALALLPKLRQTAEKFDTDVVLTFTGSWMHWVTDFPERNADNILQELAREDKARMRERYPTSKLIEFLAFRQFHANMTQPSRGRIITSYINPGGVLTDITRHLDTLADKIQVMIFRIFLARTAEEGGRTLVHGAEGARDTDGKYLDDCRSDRLDVVSPFMKSEEGAKVSKKIWAEMLERFDRVQPGISGNN